LNFSAKLNTTVPDQAVCMLQFRAAISSVTRMCLVTYVRPKEQALALYSS